MHEINLGIIDGPLPAIVACPTAAKGVECYLADETNDFGLAGSNGFQCPFYTRLLLALFQLCHVSRGPVHEIYKIQCVLRNEFVIVDVLERFVTFEILFIFIKEPGSGEQIPKHFVVGKWNTASIRTRMRIDAHKKYPRFL